MHVNVDACALADPRVKRLANKLSINVYEALGRLVHVWMFTVEHRTPLVAASDIDLLAGLPGFSDAMFAVGLAQPSHGAVLKVRGVAKRLRGARVSRTGNKRIAADEARELAAMAAAVVVDPDEAARSLAATAKDAND